MTLTIGSCTLILGDSRDVLATERFDADVMVTDPPWDAAKGIPGAANPRALFAEVIALVDANRYVVQLGCDSDPCFLAPLAARAPFLRTCWLKYACPTYKGRLLHTGDVAYAYGKWPAAKKGAMVIPGECTSTMRDADFVRGPKQKNKEKSGFAALEHPMPRRLQHVEWLVKWFAAGTVLDPFMGSGTTALAAMRVGVPFVGIEVHRPFFELAVRRVTTAYEKGTDLL